MFIRKLTDYANGKLNEDQALAFWADAIKDAEKVQLVEVYFMTKQYLKYRRKNQIGI